MKSHGTHHTIILLVVFTRTASLCFSLAVLTVALVSVGQHRYCSYGMACMLAAVCTYNTRGLYGGCACSGMLLVYTPLIMQGQSAHCALPLHHAHVALAKAVIAHSTWLWCGVVWCGVVWCAAQPRDVDVLVGLV